MISFYIFLSKAVDLINHFKFLAIAGFGLGLGMSLSLVVYQNPTVSLAGLEAVSRNEAVMARVKPTQLFSPTGIGVSLDEVNQLSQSSWYWSNRASFWNQGAAIGESGALTVVVGWRSGWRSSLSELSLGDQLEVVGDNGGRYRYGVVELREVEVAQLGQVLEQSRPTLVLVIAQHFTNNHVRVVVAR